MEISNAKNHLFLRFLAAVAATVFPNCYHLFAAHAARTLKEEMQKIRENKKGEGRFSFTFLRREISPAFKGAARSCYIKINLIQVRLKYKCKQLFEQEIMHSESTIRDAIFLFLP